MSIKTPSRPESESMHNEEEIKPLFGPDKPKIDPLEQIPTASQEEVESMRAGHTGGEKNLNSEKIKEKEQNASDNDLTDAEKKERESLYSEEDEPRGLSRLFFGKGRGGVWTRRRGAGVLITGLVFGGGLGVFSFVQGPLQFIHLSQNLQKIMRSNEDFGNDRMSKGMLYALAGKDRVDTRLGVVGNRAANIWEKKLINDTGLRPVYQKDTRRFVGFEVVDENKAARVLEEIGAEDGRGNQGRVNKSVNNGVELVSPDDVKTKGGTSVTVSGRGGEKPTGRILNLVDTSFKDRRAWIKVIGNATDVNNIVGSQASRLLIKRAGVRYHILEKYDKKKDDTIIKFKEKFTNKRNKAVSEGVKATPGPEAGKTKTNNGDEEVETVDPADEDASKETKELLKNFKANGYKIGGGVVAGPVAVVGVLCSVKNYGEHIPDYKFTNVAKPMMRLGTEIVSVGDQIKSFDDFDLESMGIMVEYLHDKETGTSFNQSESYLALQGKKGGIEPPQEMNLQNINDKPELFETVDKIPALDTACDLQDSIFGLPVIKQITGAVSKFQDFVIDGGLKAIGTSQEELLQASLSAVSGASVNPDTTRGAAYGHAAVVGNTLAANDTAIALGGGLLSDDEAQELALLDRQFEQEENQNKSVYTRYFDPFSGDSAAASVIDSTPSVGSGLATTIVNPIKNIGSMSKTMFTWAAPKASAQEVAVPDFGFERYGFSLAERDDPKFEDPYDNAALVEPQLKELNDKYSGCFGIKVSDEGDLAIENGESVNIFKFKENGGKDNDQPCDRPAKNSPDYEMYQRYRFYIADTVSMLSAECGFDESCLGIDTQRSASNSNNETSGSSTTNPNIFFLGDSLTVGMRDLGDLEKLLQEKGWEPTNIEATGSRTISLALENDIEKNTENIKKSGTIVVGLGTNDGINGNFNSKANELVKKLQGISPSAKIFWINTYGVQGFNYRLINTKIEKIDEIEVIDFASEVEKNKGLYPINPGDNVHHSAEGYKNKSKFIVESIGSPSQGGGSFSVEDIGRNSDNLSCAEGSNDLGVVTTLYDGEVKKESGPLRIRLCQIPDIPGEGNNTDGVEIDGGATVDARVSAGWVALAKKAKEDGVTLSSSSSFRLAHSCGGNGDGITCALPGKSLHQTGLAIDFNDMGGFKAQGNPNSCSGRMKFSSPQWRWMKENAEEFGIKQYSAESWHWDFLPDENRCGTNDG